MGEDSKIVVKIDGDNSGLKKDLKDTEQSLEKVGNNAESAGKPVEKLSEKIKETGDSGKEIDETADKVKKIGDNAETSEKQVATLGDLIKSNLISDAIKRGLDEVAGKIGDFISSGVDLASDLQEVKNVVDTTFGDGASQIYEWAESAKTSFGMSSLQAQKYNGTLGAMMKSMGLTDDVVLKMSTDMVGLAGDMASFYNLDVEQAFEKIRSGISGETEPLKQLGINMSVANLEAFALANGIGTAYDKMSQAEQATLRYNYLMAQTADAQGDFAKTSDSFANQQRILKLQMDELSASLGEKLLPYLNDIVSTVNEKLPRAEGTIEDIGEILGTVTGFALEHYDAIMGVVSGYLAFQGALKVGTAISTFTGAMKTLTTATQGADAAQQALNATTAANPYVLLVSIIAAVAAGLITWANNADTVHNRLKEIDKDVEEIKKNTDEKITSDEAEIEVIRRKADRYEELLNAQDRTAGQEEELKSLADELQQYMPEGTSLIDEQTGAYQSLAGTIDSVTEAMRRRARLSAYENEYNELIEKQIEAEKALEEAKKRNDEIEEKRNNGWYWRFGLGKATAETIAAGSSFDAIVDAEQTLNDINSQIADLENNIIPSLYDETGNETANAGKSQLEATREIMEQQGKEYSEHMRQSVTDYETALQEEIDAHQNALDLHRKDEDQYWAAISKYLENNKNENSALYWSTYDDYKAYIDKKKTADKKAAEDERKAAEKAAEDAKKAADEQTKTELDEIKERHEAKGDEIDYTEAATELENKLIEKGCDKNSSTWKSYFNTVDTYRKNADKQAKKDQKDALKEQQKTIDKELDNIIKKYDEKYKELENLQGSYKKKLMSIGGDLFSVEEVENEDGSKTKQYIVNDLNEQLAAMRKYHAQVMKLKEQGASNELLSELFSLGDEDSKIFADNLSKMSSSEFAKINELYNAKQQLADELAEDMYKSDAEKISAAVEDELENLANKGDTLGKQAAEIYAEAFKNELAEQFDKLEELFGDTEFTASLKAIVESESAASVPTAAYSESVVNNNVTNQMAGDASYSRIFDNFFDNFNKPIQIVLDNKIISEAVLNYSQNKRRSTGM